MRKLFIISVLFLAFGVKAQTFIVLNKVQRDSLISLLTKFDNLRNTKHIDIDPIYVMKNVYILPFDLFDKSEWATVKPLWAAKIKSKIQIRVLTQTEKDSITIRDSKTLPH